MVADTEYQISWNKKFDELKDDEKKEAFNSALGDILKWCLKDASTTFNLMNPNFKDIDNNTVFVKSITTYKISPIFAVSTSADGVKTVIGVVGLNQNAPRTIKNLIYFESFDKISTKLFSFGSSTAFTENSLSVIQIREAIANLKEALTESESNKIIQASRVSKGSLDAKKLKISFNEVGSESTS